MNHPSQPESHGRRVQPEHTGAPGEKIAGPVGELVAGRLPAGDRDPSPPGREGDG